MNTQDFKIKTKKLLENWKPILTKEEHQIVFEIENKFNDELLIIQLTKENNIWVRLKEPNSAYCCETYEEFEDYVLQLLNNTIEIAIGYKDSAWKETNIVYKNNYAELNPACSFIIASWRNQ